MSDDTFQRLGWAPPGGELPYKYTLTKYKLWPPRSKDDSHEGEGGKRPATPFLFLPTSPLDTGVRENADASWIDNGSVSLLNDDWNIETTPRRGVRYRILALVRNAGDAPALSAFVEFQVVAPPFGGNEDVFGHDPLRPGHDLGVAALSIGSRETSWALSPGTWTAGDGPFDLGLCIAARVLEPSRSSPEDWSAWSDRHVALRNLAPDLSGTWAGTETLSLPEGDPGPAPVIGEVRLSLDVQWPLQTRGGPAPADIFVLPRACSMTVLEMPPFRGRQVAAGSIHSTNFDFGVLEFRLAAPDRPGFARYVFLELRSDEELNFVTFLQPVGGTGQVDRTVATLRLVARGQPAPGIDPGLFGSLNLEVGPLATRSRREEAMRLKAIRGR